MQSYAAIPLAALAVVGAAVAQSAPEPAHPPAGPPHRWLPDLPPAPPVEDLVAEALARNPSVAALRERLAAAQEMVDPAGALPDPMVELMLQEVDFPRWTVGEEDRMVLIWLASYPIIACSCPSTTLEILSAVAR